MKQAVEFIKVQVNEKREKLQEMEKQIKEERSNAKLLKERML